MTKITLEFESATELDNFISEYVSNSLKDIDEDEEIESAEQYGERAFENEKRWSESKRDMISIQDMETHHILNALAQAISDGRKNRDERPSHMLAALVWHTWERIKEDIRENVLCED